MKRVCITTGLIALTLALGSLEVSAQGRGHGGGMGGGTTSFQSRGAQGLDRADVAAASHGYGGRLTARAHGANSRGFCPPGQRKKAGQGSRFRC